MYDGHEDHERETEDGKWYTIMKGNQVSDDNDVPRQKDEGTLEDPAVERYPRDTRGVDHDARKGAPCETR